MAPWYYSVATLTILRHQLNGIDYTPILRLSHFDRYLEYPAIRYHRHVIAPFTSKIYHSPLKDKYLKSQSIGQHMRQCTINDRNHIECIRNDIHLNCCLKSHVKC